jgi:hypothetical protein
MPKLNEIKGKRRLKLMNFRENIIKLLDANYQFTGSKK